MATYSPETREAPSDPLDSFRGLTLAFPIGLTPWAAIFRVAGCLWRGLP